MLVLSQKVGQEIEVENGGEKLTLTIIEVKGSRIRLGFKGSRAMNVRRIRKDGDDATIGGLHRD